MHPGNATHKNKHYYYANKQVAQVQISKQHMSFVIIIYHKKQHQENDDIVVATNVNIVYSYIYICCNNNKSTLALHASVVHASGSGQLQANPHVAGPWLSPGKPTRRAVTTMGFNDLVVGEVHMLGPSCQRYNWHTGRCGSIAFGSSPRRGKTLISNPRCLAEVSTRGKDFRR